MAHEKFVHHRIIDFTRKLASSDATPGGGTAAALSGLLAASLLEMVTRISMKKKPDSAALSEVLSAMPAIAAGLGELMDEDTQAYNSVMSAFKLPKNTDAEKSERSAAIQTATIHASRVPMRTARACAELLDRADAIGSEIIDNVRSDWVVAREFARTGLVGGLANVEINVSSIKNEGVVQELNAAVAELRKRLST